MLAIQQLLLSILVMGLTWSANAQDLSQVEITTHPVADGIYMLEGAGGNVGLSIGADGAFVIDDQFAPLSEKILAAIEQVTDQAVEFVLNTHWHGDHTGGNENMHGAGATIVAHENVRERMSHENVLSLLGQTVPAAPEEALPVITFSEEMTFHWNDQTINIIHVPYAHTDGDAIIYFPEANVIHSGDTFFNGSYPFVDTDSGGTINGIIAAAEKMLTLADENTRFIPGHGPVASMQDLVLYMRVMRAVRDSVQPLVDAGLTEDEVVEANPTQPWDANWGTGFVNAEVMARLVYRSLK